MAKRTADHVSGVFSPAVSVPIAKLPEQRSAADWVVVEEPLEIRLGFGPKGARQEEQISVTMRTPGADFSLAIGFLFSEGIIQNGGDILRVSYCKTVKPTEVGNVIRVELRPEARVDSGLWQRNFYTNSSCGVCGKASIDSISVPSQPLKRSTALDEKLLLSLPDKMIDSQTVFAHTGGCHAAGLFSAIGELLSLHEDIGRHNAVDKVIGEIVRAEMVVADTVLVLSGRAGFELVQKAAVAQIPTVAAVGAPSSLAIELATERGIGIYGFVRDGKANRYGA